MPIQRLLQNTLPSEREPARTPAPNFSHALAADRPQPLAGPYLEVRSVATGLATLYEKLRNTLDYRDEHLIRVYAMRRMLKRRLIRGATAEKVTMPLLEELIRGGYIPKTAVPESSIPQVTALIAKYIRLFTELVKHHTGRLPNDVWEWVYTLAANDLEAHLIPSNHRDALAEAFAGQVGHEDILQKWPLTDAERDRQIRIAVFRSLLKFNNDLITWRLFLDRYPSWTHGPHPDEYRAIAASFEQLFHEFSDALKHPVGDRLSRHLRPTATTLWLLQETLEGDDNRSLLLTQPSRLKAALVQTVEEHYVAARTRLSRTLWRSLVYILVTKMTFALLVEVPVDQFLSTSFSVFHIAFTIIVPPLLLLIFGLSVRVPGPKNTDEIIRIAEQVVYDGRVGVDPLRGPATTRSVLTKLFNAMYAVIYLLTFGFIVYLLWRFSFPVLSILIFLLFLTLISFFGFRIREQSLDLVVKRGSERFLVFIAVLFFLPIVRTGRWISQQSSKINIFLYFFDLFIEAPLQAFLEFFDKFTGFVREKKEDITS